MGAVYFYHLTDSPLDHTLPPLLGKARAAGWRVLVRAEDADLRDRMDVLLWQDGFLPHGIAGGPHDAEQPILLGAGVSANGFDCVVSIAGAAITALEVQQAERAMVLFDGHDEAALSYAREQWKVLTDAGCAAQYWAQVDGRWSKKAEK